MNRSQIFNMKFSFVLVILMGFCFFLNKHMQDLPRKDCRDPSIVSFLTKLFAGPPGSDQKFHRACCFHHKVLRDLYFEASVRDLSVQITDGTNRSNTQDVETSPTSFWSTYPIESLFGHPKDEQDSPSQFLAGSLHFQ